MAKIKHVIAYEGILVSLGVMQESYMEEFTIWANKRVGIEGTLLRPPYSLEGGREWVRNLEKTKGQHEIFAVLGRTQHTKHVTHRYVGHMGIHDITWPHGFAKTGSVIGAEEGRGRGYGTEAKLLLMHHAFHILGLRKMWSTVKSFNAPSMGHLMKCGYEPCGRLSAHHFHEGRYEDEIILQVFRERWEPIWKKYRETKRLPKLTDEQRTLITEETRR